LSFVHKFCLHFFCAELGNPLKGLNCLQQFLAFLQPRRWVRGALEVEDHAVLIHDDGGGALDANEVLDEFKAMIDGTFRVGQDRERCFERLCIPAGPLQCVAKNNQNLRPGFDKLIIQAPQLGDVRAALHSVVFAHEE
jgi:hypothetical protein